MTPRPFAAVLLLVLSATSVQAGAFHRVGDLALPASGPAGLWDDRLVLVGGEGNPDAIHWYDVGSNDTGFLQSQRPAGSTPLAWVGPVVFLAGRQPCALQQCWSLARFDATTDTINAIVTTPGIPSVNHDGVPAAAWSPQDAPLRGCGGGCLYVFSEDGEVYAVHPGSGQTKLVTAGDFRGHQHAFWYSGAIYLVGGLNVTGWTTTVWRFDPAAESLTLLANAGPCACIVQATPYGDKVLLHAALLMPGFVRTDAVWEFDPATATSRETGWRLPGSYSSVAAAIVDGAFVMAGGSTGQGPRRDVWHRSFVNDAPLVEAWGPPYSPRSGEVTEFEASATDPDGSIAGVAWTFGDGGTATGSQVAHAFAATGTYTVTATATDNEGATASRSLNVTVIAQPTSSATSSSSGTSTAPAAPPSNQPPVAKPSCQANGMTAHCSALGSADPEGQALSLSWSWGDGATSTGSPVSHTYAAPGAYAVTLTASDGDLSLSSAVQVVAEAAATPSASQTQTATSPASTSHSASATLAAVEEGPEEASSLTAGALLAVALAAIGRRRT